MLIEAFRSFALPTEFTPSSISGREIVQALTEGHRTEEAVRFAQATMDLAADPDSRESALLLEMFSALARGNLGSEALAVAEDVESVTIRPEPLVH
jgi:hypothetical protein